MGSSFSMMLIVTCASVVLAALAGTVLEQINQKLELLEKAISGKRAPSDKIPEVRLIGWQNSDLENWKDHWFSKIQRDKNVTMSDPNKGTPTTFEVNNYGYCYL